MNVTTGVPTGDDTPSQAGTLPPDEGADRLRRALTAARIGVWEWDRSRDVITWDGALAELFGLDPDDAPRTFDEYAALLHPDDRDATASTVQAALERGEPFRVEHRITLPDGTERWILGHGFPTWEGGELAGLTGVSRDITVRRRVEMDNARLLAEESMARAEADAARGRLEFLLEAKAEISKDLDLPDRLDTLARLSIPRFADGSAVHLVGEDDEVHLVSLHHRTPEKGDLIRSLLERYPVRLDQPVGIGAAIRRGRSGLLPAITDEMLVAAAANDEHLELLRSLDLTAGVVVPLKDEGGPFGAVTFMTTGGRRMTESDLELVEQLCSRIAVLVRNAQLIEAREIDRAASRYQAALLQSMFEASVDGVIGVGTAGEVLAYNQRFLHLWELGESDVEDRLYEQILEATATKVVDPEAFVDTVRVADRDLPARVHDQIDMTNGRVLDRNGTRLVGPDGEHLGFVWSVRDVTLERAQAEAIAEAGERSATLARTLQQSLLPPRLPQPRGLELAARYHAAYEGLEVGGDFYDVFAIEGGWMLAIGDVCGKGAEAATLTALARYTIRAASIHDTDPSSILRELNAAMIHDADPADGFRRFATVSCIRICRAGTDDDSVDVDVACGGHPPALVRRADGTTETAGKPGTLLGVFDEVTISTHSLNLAVGDAIIALTDGVLEARGDDGDMLEIEGVVEAITTPGVVDASALCQMIEARALDVQDGVARDDIAILVARVMAT
ncbi:MAG: SpoIIE family protein phosphatase [Acidimicrobiales bacterium]